MEPDRVEQIFVTYARSDGAFVDLLRQSLQEAGFDVWIDTLNLPAGAPWREEIDRAIRESAVMIAVMSPAAFESKYVTYEWAFSLGVGRPVIPLLIENTELHPRIEALQYVDFTDPAAYPWNKLVQVLYDAVARTTVSGFSDLMKRLKDRKKEARNNAIAELKRVSNPDALPHLNAVLFGDHKFVKDVRGAAVLALGNLGEHAVPSLLKAMQDRDRDVRFDAAGELKDIGEPAVPGLLNLLQYSENGSVRRSAAWALGEIGSLEAVDELIRRLDDHDRSANTGKRVSDTAAEALQRIGSEKAMDAVTEWWITQLDNTRKHWKPETRICDYAADVLTEIGAKRALEAVRAWRERTGAS